MDKYAFRRRINSVLRFVTAILVLIALNGLLWYSGTNHLGSQDHVTINGWDLIQMLTVGIDGLLLFAIGFWLFNENGVWNVWLENLGEKHAKREAQEAKMREIASRFHHPTREPVDFDPFTPNEPPRGEWRRD